MNRIAKLRPIVLSEFGDTLREYPRQNYGTCCDLLPYEVNPDLGELSTCVGVHDTCRGWMDIRDISSTHRRLRCRACGFTLTLPKNVKTYGDLRVWVQIK